MPAQSNGAAYCSSISLGILMAKCSVTTMLFEYPPCVIPVGDDASGVPYVPTIPVVSQWCSSPFLQLSHFIQLLTIQPTPALSPSLNLLTFFPTAVTMPAISCPGTCGYCC